MREVCLGFQAKRSGLRLLSEEENGDEDTQRAIIGLTNPISENSNHPRI